MNTDQASQAAILSAVRTLLSAIGGTLLVARGITDQQTLQDIIGAIMVLAPTIWGVVNKFRAEHKIQIRTTEAVNVGVMAANKDMAGGTVSHADAQALIAKLSPATQLGAIP